ncbi:acyl-CoA dehydrogenase [Sphingobacterium sp. lm-10]|uniref:acyl-CoA dehydrogenase family protein n=1 Tax=Sphingobacterium sp. lm-10 TaxID=2944904 RepID=UPI00202230D6|nr:acyl-CoA dehydrogenase family protein [Sphingobacterium sp. lm-10]MCL7986796.1 acyl-CoA dehydrogenase [Sphingobacterium sp. lm-10]
MLSEDIIELIEENEAYSAKAGVLSDVVLKIAFEKQWFNLWVPKEYGGLELELADGCRLLESLAYWDGSLGWTVTLCAGANMFAGFIDVATAKTLFLSGNVCFGGSGRASGKAIPVPGGYQLTGRWSYATGAPHLSHFTCNAVVFSGEDIAENQQELVKSFFVSREHVLIENDWQTFGLEATASHSFSIQDAFIPQEHCFELSPKAATHTSLLFQYPFLPFAEFTLFVNYLGMFSRYTDLVQKNFYLRAKDALWQEKHGKQLFKQLDRAQQFAEQSRKRIYELMEETWSNLLRGDYESNAILYSSVAAYTRQDLTVMRSHMMDLHVKCGISAAQSDSPLNRVFRNFFTATQHALLQS